MCNLLAARHNHINTRKWKT